MENHSGTEVGIVGLPGGWVPVPDAEPEPGVRPGAGNRGTRFPAIHAFCAPARKLGGDNADFVYLQAWIDGESVYKIPGNEGSARHGRAAAGTDP